MKFENPDGKFTANDFEKFVEEQAHMEGLAINTFKADIMKNLQFPDLFEKFKKEVLNA